MGRPVRDAGCSIHEAHTPCDRRRRQLTAENERLKAQTPPRQVWRGALVAVLAAALILLLRPLSFSDVVWVALLALLAALVVLLAGRTTRE